jgi:hypothetical protein
LQSKVFWIEWPQQISSGQDKPMPIDATDLATARAVMANPQNYISDPAALGCAFLALAIARGATVRPENLPAPQHGIGWQTAHRAPIRRNLLFLPGPSKTPIAAGARPPTPAKKPDPRAAAAANRAHPNPNPTKGKTR